LNSEALTSSRELGAVVEEAPQWNEFRTGWRVLLVSLIGMMVSVGTVPIYTIGAFTLPLQGEFGWSRGDVQYAMTAYFVGAIIAAATCGLLLRRFEVRQVAIAGLFGSAIGFTLLSLINESIWSLYVGMFGLIVLGAGSTTATWTLATNYWFVRHRGLALAVVLSGTGLCSLIAPMYVTKITQLYGWRAAFIGLALPSLFIALPAVLLLLPRTSRAPVVHAGSVETQHIASPVKGVPLAQALKSWRLWVMSIALMLVVVGIFGLVPNMIPLMRDAGLSAQEAASLAGMIGVALVISRLGSGYLIDRLWAPGVAAILLSMPAVACAILLLGLDSWYALLLVVILTGIGTGAENDVAAYITARYFGLRDYGSVFSIQTMVITAGNMVGPLMFGSMYNATGSYDPMLWTCAGLFLTGALLLLTLGRYPRFD
jgi:predicted MFS family arabinose efflux permease